MAKNPFPFRLGTTSYIIPADILPNVEFLAPQVDDIELVFFQSEEFSNLPDDETVEQLRNWKQSAQLSYTVHLPLDADLGSADRNERERSVAKCKGIIQMAQPLEPLYWILHLPGRRRGNPPAADVEDWLEKLDLSVKEILNCEVPSRQLCVETLDYHFELVEQLLNRHDLSVCLDVGHMLTDGRSVESHFERYAERYRVVHLHGLRDAQDHCSISQLDRSILDLVIEKVSAPGAEQRVLTLEVFSKDDFSDSMESLKGLL